MWRRYRRLVHLLVGVILTSWWPIVVTGFGGYATYRARTDRPIPLVILEPVSGAATAPGVAAAAAAAGGAVDAAAESA